jgi:transcriptional regulator with XRE-family HTH domain
MVKRSKFKKKEIAEKLGIDTRTLRRYQNGEREMTADVYWKLVLITKFYTILPIIFKELNRNWRLKKQGKKFKDADEHKSSE